MSRFTLTENIRRFRDLLAQPLDPVRRRTVEALLVEEEAKLAREPAEPTDGPLSGRSKA